MHDCVLSEVYSPEHLRRALPEIDRCATLRPSARGRDSRGRRRGPCGRL